VRREQIAALNERADASDLADLGKKKTQKKAGTRVFCGSAALAMCNFDD
jgi:hypothetical protein